MARGQVQGNQYLNFTPAEAAEWLGEIHPPQGQRGREVHGDAAVPVFFFFALVIFFVVWAIIALANHARTSAAGGVQWGNGSQTAHAMVQTTNQSNVLPQQQPSVPVQGGEVPTAKYLPDGWYLARMTGEAPLFNGANRVIGVLPEGLRFFATSGPKVPRTVVLADGSNWGYAHVGPEPVSVQRIRIEPAYDKAVELIYAIQHQRTNERAPADGERVAAFRNPHLPTGWMVLRHHDRGYPPDRQLWLRAGGYAERYATSYRPRNSEAATGSRSWPAMAAFGATRGFQPRTPLHKHVPVRPEWQKFH